MKNIFKLIFILSCIITLFSCKGFSTKDYKKTILVNEIINNKDNYGFYKIVIKYNNNIEYYETFTIVDTLGKYNVGDTLILIKK